MSSKINYQNVEIQTLTTPQITGRGTISESVTPNLGKLVFDSSGPELFIGDGTNWIPVGGGTGAGFSVGAPILATDNNGMKLTGTVLSSEFADATHNGIVSTVVQQWSGEKEFLNSLLSYRINLVDGGNNCVAGVGANLLNGGSNGCYFGVNAGKNITTGSNNVCVGFNSLQAGLLVSNVIAIGSRSLYNATNCLGTVAIGVETLESVTTTVVDAVAIGYQTLKSLTTGIGCVAIGYQAGNSLLTGGDNTMVGYNTLFSLTNGYQNTAIGSNCLNSSVGGFLNTAIGDYALGRSEAGNRNTAIGYSALLFNNSGQENVAIGGTSMQNNLSGNYNIGIGNSCMASCFSGRNNTVIGYAADCGNGEDNIMIGPSAGAGQQGFRNVIVGSNAFTNFGSGNDNVGIGFLALSRSKAASNNVGIGRAALYTNQTGTNNVAIGYAALTLATNSSNTGIGYQALLNLTSGSSNIAIGLSAGGTLTTGSGNIYIGANAALAAEATTIRIGTSQTRNFQSGIRGVTPDALDGQIVYISSQGQLCTVGTSSQTPWLLGGNSGTVPGTSYIGASDNQDIQISTNGTAGYGLFLRANGRVENVNPLANVSFGPSAGNPGAGSQNIFVGRTAGQSYTSTNSIGIGDLCMNNTTGGNGNIGIGAVALSTVTGTNNTACGIISGNIVTTGTNNSLYGAYSGSTITTGSGNVLCGTSAGGLIATGDNNTFVGAYSGQNATGTNNMFLGIQAGYNITTTSNNIMIANQGVVGDSAVIRIGNGQVRNFQDGIYGVTTDIGVAIPVLVSPSGQLGTVSSLRKLKDGIVDVDEDTNHEIISKLKPRRFYMKSDETKRLTYGMIVDEVIDVHPDLIATDLEGKPNTIIYSDISIMLLKEVQRCNKVIDKMLTRINGLEKYLELPVMPVEPLVEPLVVVDPVIPVEAVVEPVVVVDPVDNILEDPVDNILEDPVNNVVV